MAWIKPLFHRAITISSNPGLCKKQIYRFLEISNTITFMSWNGFPRIIWPSIIRKLKWRYFSNAPYKVSIEHDNSLPRIWLRLSYLRKQGECLVKTVIKKICHNLSKTVKFIVIYLKKVPYFLNNKDKIPKFSHNNAVNEIKCQGCNQQYIGKTGRSLEKWFSEHPLDSVNSAVANHFIICDHINYLLNQNNLATAFIIFLFLFRTTLWPFVIS